MSAPSYATRRSRLFERSVTFVKRGQMLGQQYKRSNSHTRLRESFRRSR